MPPPANLFCETTDPELARYLAASIWGNVAFAQELGPILQSGAPTADVIKFMQADQRSQAGLQKFALDWFELPNVSIDFGGSAGAAGASNSPQYAPEQLMAEEGRLFVEWSVQDRQGTLERLFTSSQSVINQELAAYYAVPPPASPPGSNLWNMVDLGGQERFGILTRGFWLARHVNSARRGKTLLEGVLCSPIPRPPSGTLQHSSEPPPQLSALEIKQQANDPSCQGCHALIDPAGVAFERFNGVGQYRSALGGQPIDSSGHFVHPFDLGESRFKFQDVREFMGQLSSSPDLETCLVKKVAAYTQREANGALSVDATALGCVLKNNFGLQAQSIADAFRVLLSSLRVSPPSGLK